MAVIGEDVESPKAARGKLNKKDFRRNYNGVVEKILQGYKIETEQAGI